jgi:hypothetical protein
MMLLNDLDNDSEEIRMKKITVVMLIVLLTLSPLFAGDFEFVLDEFGTNNDVGFGFLPTFLTAGAAYTGFQFIDGQKSDLMFIGGGGYTQRQVWRDAGEGQVDTLSDDQRLFNVISGEWKVLLEQGLLWSDMTYSDLITFTLGYQGRYERYIENQGGSNSAFFDHPFFPEGEQLVANEFVFGARMETVLSEKVTKQGIDAEFTATYAPAWLLNDTFLDSTVDYLGLALTIDGYLPIHQQRAQTGMNALSVFLADRVRIDFIEGDAVPVYAQRKSSLGFKMRGFEAYSYATSFNIVNNLDLRISGPEFVTIGLFPRGAVFVDLGYYTGHLANSDVQIDGSFLMSTGIEVAVSVFDFLNLGVRGNYALVGETLTDNDMSLDIFMVMHY